MAPTEVRVFAPASVSNIGCGFDILGFAIEDLFVVGYGLDYDQMYRNIPEVAVYRP